MPGKCKVCEEVTESIIIWDGKPEWLCPKCAERIRSGKAEALPGS